MTNAALNTELRIHEGTIEIEPEEAGFHPNITKELHDFYQNLINKGKIQGASYLLARHGRICACNSMGRLVYDNYRRDLMPDSIRKVSSITKVFTSTAILQLIEAGKLYLEQPVADIIDEFNTHMHRGITLYHLLTHTSGIMAEPTYYLEPYSKMDIYWTLDNNKSWIQKLLEEPVKFKPGEHWAYSSPGFAILGEVIRRTTNMPYDEYVKANILDPLEMHETFFSVPDNLLDRVSLAIDYDKDMVQTKPGYFDPFTCTGGLHSTLYDLYNFCEMMRNKGTYKGNRILGRITIERATKNNLKDIPAFLWGNNIKAYPFGLGWDIEYRNLIGPNTYKHEGSGRSTIYVDPDHDLVFIHMTPMQDDWVPEAVLNPPAIVWGNLQ